MKVIQWDIVYIKFPFTNLTDYKLRPALILSNNHFNQKENIFVLGIFSNPWIDIFSLELNQENLKEWTILKRSFLRFQNMFTLEKSLIERKIGAIKHNNLISILEKLENYVSLDK